MLVPISSTNTIRSGSTFSAAAVGLLHARLGHVYPTEPVSLADIHLSSPFCLMIAILPGLARLGTVTPQVFLSDNSPFSAGYELPIGLCACSSVAGHER